MPLECRVVRARDSERRNRERAAAKVPLEHSSLELAGPSSGDVGVEAVLGLQRSLGNQAVSRLVAPMSRAPTLAIQRTEDEAQGFIDEGVEWHKQVWLKGDDTARAALVEKLNQVLSPFGITVRRGFQRYDPVVVTGAPLTYQKIVADAKGQADGGVSYAKQFKDWYDGDTALAALPRSLQALALITHWAEVARGYENALGGLYAWIDEIAAAGTKEEARALWGDFNDRYAPSLTYAKDAAQEFEEDVEMEEQRREEDQPFEEELMEIPEEDMALVRKNKPLAGRLRSGKK
jgi:hypothetical protein